MPNLKKSLLLTLTAVAVRKEIYLLVVINVSYRKLIILLNIFPGIV